MSISLYFRRAFFENGRGALKRGSVVIPIRRMPQMPGARQFIAIDYAPRVVELIQEYDSQRRDMTRTEKDWINAILDKLTEGSNEW